MRKLLSAVVLAMSVMFVQGCGDGGLPHPGPQPIVVEDNTAFFTSSFDLTRIGTAPAPFFALPDLILSESYTFNSDKTWTWTRLRQTNDSSTTPIGVKQQTLTNTGTWEPISGTINGFRLHGTYSNTLVNPPRTTGGELQYDVTPITKDNLIQLRINGQNWEYVRRAK